MTQQTADIGAGAERPTSEPSKTRQMGAAQAAQTPKAPRVVAAFGTGGGAAIVFSDLASI